MKLSSCVDALIYAIGMTAYNYNVENNRVPLLYLSTNEGIGSHVTQVKLLLDVALSYNRSVIVAPFTSKHYHEGQRFINMCSLFQFPPEVMCFDTETKDFTAIATHCDCQYFNGKDADAKVTKATWHSYYRTYNLPVRVKGKREMPFTKAFDFANGECVAGFVSGATGYVVKGDVASANKDDAAAFRRPSKMTENGFNAQLKYHSFARAAYYELVGHPPAKVLVAIHWRRGDIHEPSGRCATSDKSFNCLTDNNEVVATMNAYVKRATENVTQPVAVYLATNERNQTLLRELRTNKIMSFQDLSVSGMALYDEEIFTTELTLIREFAHFLIDVDLGSFKTIAKWKTSSRVHDDPLKILFFDNVKERHVKMLKVPHAKSNLSSKA